MYRKWAWNMRRKQVENLAALRALARIYRMRGFKVIYVGKRKIEAYDSQGKLRQVAEARSRAS